MHTGKVMTKSDVEYVNRLERLWDLLSDTIESGRLKENDIPEDYDALVETMQSCERAFYRAEHVA